MAAPPSAGVAVSEQERLVALILVLTRDPFLSNPRRSLAGRDSLGLSLEGCEPIGPLASKLCTITPGCRLLLPPPPHSGGRSEYKEPMPQLRSHYVVTGEVVLFGEPHGVELIVEVMAGRDRPAAHAGAVRHDTVPLERVDVVGLLVEETLFEGLDVSPTLVGIHGATLPDVEVVQHGIGVPAVVGIASARGLELIEIQVWIDHVPALEVSTELEVPGPEVLEVLG